MNAVQVSDVEPKAINMQTARSQNFLFEQDFYGAAATENAADKHQVRGDKGSDVVLTNKWNLAKYFALGGTVTVSSLVLYHVALLALVNSLTLPY